MDAQFDPSQFMDEKRFAYAVCAWLLWTQYKQLGLILHILGRISAKLNVKTPEPKDED